MRQTHANAPYVTLPPASLMQAGLEIARWVCYPDLDLPRYQSAFDTLVLRVRDGFPQHLPPAEQAAELARRLFRVENFQGNAAAYFDPRNSFLNDVLDRRLGIPITLSVMFIETAGRLGLNVRGVGLPGHFITRLDAGAEPVFIDPFHGGRMVSQQDCEELVYANAGPRCAFNPRWLEPVDNTDILARMLANLRGIYLHNQDWGRMLRVLELLRAVQPGEHGHIRDLGLVHYQAGDRGQAIYHLETYLMRSFHAPDSGVIRAHLTELIREVARAN